MTNVFDEMRAAVQSAKLAQQAVNENATAMCGLIAGNLRAARVDVNYLRKLKRELRDFDMTTGRWK